MKKLVIVMAGGGAAGKSTTSKAFAIGEPVQRYVIMDVDTEKGVRPMGVNWTIYDNYALVGNHKSGTDSNTGPGATRAAFFEAMKVRDVVIVDGMISTPKWALMCDEWQEHNPNVTVRVLVLHFSLPAEELLTRLARRRGVDKESIRESMFGKCVTLVRRAELLVGHFDKLCTLERVFLTVYSADSTDDIVDLLDAEVEDYFQEGE